MKFQQTISLLLSACLVLSGCFVVEVPYQVGKGVVKGAAWTGKTLYKITKGTVITTYELTAGATRLVYKIGKFSFEVVRAPLDWPLMNEDIETIDGLPVKEAIRLGRVKTASYVVKGKQYVPMSVADAQGYEEVGTASWYGYETLRQSGGRMTANGEAFDPNGLTAAHKTLPLPTNVEVTNLENDRTIVVRVNDRGPFPSDHNAGSGKRIIDLSLGAAKKLGFHQKGTARVRVKAIPVEGIG